MAATVTIPALLTLFKIDRDLHALRVALDTVQKDQKRQQAKIVALQKDHDTRDLANKKLQAEVSGKELEIKSRQEHIDKMRATLNNTKTNKEYSAILITISAEKGEVAKIETAALEQMQTVESAAKEVASLKAQIAAEQAVLAKIEAEHSEKVSNLQRQIDELSIKRNDAAKHVPNDALRQYDRVSLKYPGDAMAPMEYDEGDLDNISCGSCYMGLTTEHLNGLRGRDQILRCDSCTRILYLPEMALHT